jgi:hypothetical protein
MVLFIMKTKRLQCPCGLKGKWQLMKGSLVRHSLCCTWRHRTDRLLLHFHATSVMMPHAPPVVTHLPILRQKWETLAWLASWWSKLPDVDACPDTVFIRHRFWGTNQQTSSPWFWGPIQEIIVVILKPKSPNRSAWFWGPNQETLAVVLRPNY